MRISFDLDGVLADMDSALATIAEREFGIAQRLAAANGGSSNAAQDGDKVDGADGGQASPGFPTAAILAQLTSREQARLWQRVRDTHNFWETLAEHEPGTVRRIQDLAYHLRWDVLFVTQRPSTAGRTAQIQSQRWLRQQGFDIPAVYTTRGSRGRIADALSLDAHVDDRIENAMDIATESRAWSVLVWRDETSFDRIAANARRLNIAAVRTMAEALDRIEAADRGGDGASRRSIPVSVDDEEEHTGPALLDRLKKAFSRR